MFEFYFICLPFTRQEFENRYVCSEYLKNCRVIEVSNFKFLAREKKNSDAFYFDYIRCVVNEEYVDA